MNKLYIIVLATFFICLYAFTPPKEHFIPKKTTNHSKDSIPVFLEGYKFENADGTMFNFNQVKGKVLLIDFWATWCAPCIKEHPKVETINKSIQNQDFQVIYISVDKNKSKWKNFLKTKQWSGIHIKIDNNDNKNPLNKMVIESITNNGNTLFRTSVPRYYLIDKNLNVDKIDINTNNLISIIKEKLN